MCDVVYEEGENSGCWVECTLCNEWHYLDYSRALEARSYCNLEEFDFSYNYVSSVASYIILCQLQKTPILYIVSYILTAAFYLMKFNSM